jgi:hypothetical protein
MMKIEIENDLTRKLCNVRRSCKPFESKNNNFATSIGLANVKKKNIKTLQRLVGLANVEKDNR